MEYADQPQNMEKDSEPNRKMIGAACEYDCNGKISSRQEADDNKSNPAPDDDNAQCYLLAAMGLDAVLYVSIPAPLHPK